MCERWNPRPCPKIRAKCQRRGNHIAGVEGRAMNRGLEAANLFFHWPGAAWGLPMCGRRRRHWPGAVSGRPMRGRRRRQAAVALAGRCVGAADAWEAAAALDGSCVGAADAREVAAAARKTQVHGSVRNWHRSEGK